MTGCLIYRENNDSQKVMDPKQLICALIWRKATPVEGVPY